jgi:hypothetical protein
VKNQIVHRAALNQVLFDDAIQLVRLHSPVPSDPPRMTTAQQLHHHLVYDVFAGAIAGDVNLKAAVDAFGGDVCFDAGDLLFTLPHLLRFLLLHCEASGHGVPDAQARDYRVFRRLLYGAEVNTALRPLGAVVVVERADADHRLSRYRLTRLPARTGIAQLA